MADQVYSLYRIKDILLEKEKVKKKGKKFQVHSLKTERLVCAETDCILISTKKLILIMNIYILYRDGY